MQSDNQFITTFYIMKQKIITIPITDLHLWTENPRDPMDISFSDYDIIKRAVEDKNSKWELPKLVEKMGDHYDFSELPTIVLEKGEYLVYDGNRRIAVLKYLQNKELYQAFGGGLFKEFEPQALRELKKIPCNLCDKNTALVNIERKHINNGTWTALDREYFLYKHRGQEKSIFLNLEENTGIISANNKLNKRFVKEEVFTEENLKSIGFNIYKGKMFSSYDDETSSAILKKITELITNKTISTRNNRPNTKGVLKNILKKNTKIDIREFDANNSQKFSKKNRRKGNKNNSSTNIVRRTPTTNPYKKDVIFGRVLTLQYGSVNNLYSGICLFYDKVKNDNNNLFKFLPILGMSLRLILDVAGREYFKNLEEEYQQDAYWSYFIKQAKKDFRNLNDLGTLNFISLNQGWLESGQVFEAPLGKWAHGTLPTSKEDVLQASYIVGDILMFYFAKNE